MNAFDWPVFLAQWSQVLLEYDRDAGEDYPQDVIQSGWLGFPGATEDDIQRAEHRLGTRLPPSYRAFLAASNGWRKTGPFIDRLWSTDEIEWLSVRHQDFIDICTQYAAPVADDVYFTYGNNQNSGAFRAEYLQTALEISAWGDSAIYFLNPQVVTAEGEWEAWFYADWTPGAERYRSFQEMMQAQYEDCAVLLKRSFG